MTGGDDPLCRAGMVWDPALCNRRIFETYRTLIHLRRRNFALTHGGFETLRVFNGVYAYRRFMDDSSVVVIMNPRETRHNVTIPLGGANGSGTLWRDQLTGKTVSVKQGQFILDILPAGSAKVLTPTKENEYHAESHH